ncbi:hypothetical protein [Acinetobacter soli]|uniref:hypothetical protein n=1 Tax=Acinetobacter soli TaxID=487316 RepID=UPI00124F7A76|nr:hypothetical protein [Acinetobacter soli]
MNYMKITLGVILALSLSACDKSKDNTADHTGVASENQKTLADFIPNASQNLENTKPSLAEYDDVDNVPSLNDEANYRSARFKEMQAGQKVVFCGNFIRNMDRENAVIDVFMNKQNPFAKDHFLPLVLEGSSEFRAIENDIVCVKARFVGVDQYDTRDGDITELPLFKMDYMMNQSDSDERKREFLRNRNPIASGERAIVQPKQEPVIPVEQDEGKKSPFSISTKIGKQITGRCYMGECSYSKIVSVKPQSLREETKVNVSLLGGSVEVDDNWKALSDINWNKKPHKITVYCSRTKPRIVMGSDIEELALGKDGVPSVQENSAIIYFEICHSFSGDSYSGIKKFNYNVVQNYE